METYYKYKLIMLFLSYAVLLILGLFKISIFITELAYKKGWIKKDD